MVSRWVAEGQFKKSPGVATPGLSKWMSALNYFAVQNFTQTGVGTLAWLPVGVRAPVS